MNSVQDHDPFTTEGGQAKVSASTITTSAVARSARGLLRQPRFLLAATVLLVCAAGFNAAAGALKLHFRKEAVPLRVRGLDDKVEGLPTVLGGRWFNVSDDQPMPSAFEHALGTQQYVFRDYVDLEAMHCSVEEARAMPREKLLREVAALRATQPQAVVRVGITYYTGLVDTVSHIPDRCMVADGFQVAETPQVVTGPSRYVDGKPRPMDFRYLTFEDVTGRGRVTRNVGYFFHVNGAYESDPKGVRMALQDLFQRYGYYAKVELLTEQGAGQPAFGKRAPGANNYDPSASAFRQLLESLVPEVERCLPDWQAVQQGEAATAAVR